MSNAKRQNQCGVLHPISQFLRITIGFFESRGFKVIVETPEIESEWYNFDALNMPENHPSRDIQDTFWLKDKRVLRTHTTSADARIIKEQKLQPPLALIFPGRCFRHEATDQTHEHTFYQIDAIAISENVSMRDLVNLLDDYMKAIFGQDIKTRLRPHFYPFVEPGMDLDILISQKSNLKSQNWREMLGAGMAHPIVLKNMGLDPKKWQAIMFGMGIDRFMMEYFAVNDIRLSYSGDLRFLKQFQ